jgi:hypothetical protein
MKSVLFALLTLTLAQAHADDSTSGANYDSIVRDLTSSSTYDAHTEKEHDALDLVKFHISAGLVSSQLNLDLPGAYPHSTTLHGYEVGFGIDLFSPSWVAQFDIRTYEPDDIGTNNELTFKEFDLLLMHRSPIVSQLSWNIGAGLAARYLDLKYPVANGGDNDYSTPASVITTGLAFSFTPEFSIDALVSLRSRLVENTPDGGSIDGTLHLTGHF